MTEESYGSPVLPSVAPSQAGLAALLRRVDKAEARDEDLNAAIWYALHPDREDLWARSGLNAQRPLHSEKTLRATVLDYPREYGFDPRNGDVTGSVEATLALVERLLRTAHPHMTVSVKWFLAPSTPSARAEITWPSREFTRHHRTGALALLSALLRALQPQGQTHG